MNPSISAFEAFIQNSCLRGDLLKRICDYWTPRDIFALGGTSVLLHMSIEAYVEQVWNVDVFFSNWLRHPESFRQTLQSACAVVSGQEVFRFFDRLRRPWRARLEIFVRPAGLKEVIFFLRGEGYAYVPRLGSVTSLESHIQGSASMDKLVEAGGNNTILRAFDFVHSSSYAFEYITVYAINVPPFQFIACGMDSRSEAISMFPLSTFHYRKAYTCSNLGGTSMITLKSAEELGFEVITNDAADNLPSKYEGLAKEHGDMCYGHRRVKDSKSWVLKCHSSPSTSAVKVSCDPSKVHLVVRMSSLYGCPDASCVLIEEPLVCRWWGETLRYEKRERAIDVPTSSHITTFFNWGWTIAYPT
ncbi:hypothetical protein BKA70DRAFT_1239680 [Coprinopsis sp. MPI-PUGE-AT-0042]|nr:hypothetical protein BKA70DRAFT_1239680 [Coprinopsis sp. MPI-PUGE-AT-0042]